MSKVVLNPLLPPEAYHHRLNELKATLAAFVYQARKAMGWNQAELAEKLNLDQSALSRVENGLQGLTGEQLVMVCLLTQKNPLDLAMSFTSSEVPYQEAAQLRKKRKTQAASQETTLETPLPQKKAA